MYYQLARLPSGSPSACPRACAARLGHPERRAGHRVKGFRSIWGRQPSLACTGTELRLASHPSREATRKPAKVVPPKLRSSEGGRPSQPILSFP